MGAKEKQDVQPELSLVLPCYNEALGIEAFLVEWLGVLRQTVSCFEILVINDGSTDGSGRILDKLRRDNRELRVFHQLNVGHGRAIRRGYEAARGRFVVQVDSNGCFEVSDFLRLWEHHLRYKLVLGRRTHRIDSLLRRGAANLSRQTIEWLFDVELIDPGSPFRVMERSTLIETLPKIPHSFDGTNLALSVLFKQLGENAVIEIPVPFRLRRVGQNKTGLMATLAFTRNMMGELLNLKWSSSSQRDTLPL